MLMIGDISGIQNYLFDISNDGGGQARRMRARSLYIQLVSECALRRILDACEWDDSAVAFCGAGKFILDHKCEIASVEARVRAEVATISELLLEDLGGRLRFSMAWCDDDASVQTKYETAQRRLQIEKARGWRDVAAIGSRWRPEAFRLQPLNTPCAICGKKSIGISETGESLETSYNDKEKVKVCQLCFDDFEIGRRMPQLPHVFIGDGRKNGNAFNILGKTVTFSNSEKLLASAKPPGRRIERPLARHIPTVANGVSGHGDVRPLSFREIAWTARGNALLGVLKADADSMGEVFNGLLAESQNLEPMKNLSVTLDQFFARALDEELERSQVFKNIYTIFAGGDDLLLVGPWDATLAYAGYMQQLFDRNFKPHRLTISAGIAFFAPTRPVKFAVEVAERLLAAAKAEPGKDSVATLGQVWNWRAHPEILEHGQLLANWIDQGVMPRGSAHTLLRFALARDAADVTPGERLSVTAKLAWHVSCNYQTLDVRHFGRSPTEKEEMACALRRWVEGVLEDFDERNGTISKFLPAILRYALMATRKKEDE
jgi:CRISPR-associated protein Csm1